MSKDRQGEYRVYALCVLLAIGLLSGCASVSIEKDGSEEASEKGDVPAVEENIIESVTDVQKLRAECVQLLRHKGIEPNHRVWSDCEANLNRALFNIERCRDDLAAERVRIINEIRGGLKKYPNSKEMNEEENKNLDESVMDQRDPTGEK